MSTSESPTRKPFHHGDLANALLNEAQSLLRDRGAHGFSLREAARAVGVSSNAAYRHFEDKGALLAALAKRGFAQMACKMEEAMDRSVGPIERLKATGEGYLLFARSERALFDLMFGPYGAGGTRDVVGVGQQSGLSPGQLLSKALDDLVTGGMMTQERRAGAEALLWPAIHGLAVLQGTGAWKQGSNSAFDRMFAFMELALDLRSER